MATVPDPMSRSSSYSLGGRGRGVMIGSLMAFGWAFYAVGAVTGVTRIVLILVAAGITIALMVAASAMIRAAKSASTPTADQVSANRQAWRWFWVNFAAEIILLNVAVGLLAAPRLHVFWVPAISAVVGLHFIPMAMFFRVRSYWYVGGAMIGVAAITAYVIAHNPGDAYVRVHEEGLVNAAILWGALAAGALGALLPSSRARS